MKSKSDTLSARDLQKKQPRKLTVAAVALELRVSNETVRKRLRDANIDPKAPITWREILRAWLGDPVMARTRRATAEAEVLELKAARMRGELMDRQEAEVMVRGWLGPVRELLVAVPDEMAARCNPADPEHARLQLVEWRDRALRTMGGGVPC